MGAIVTCLNVLGSPIVCYHSLLEFLAAVQQMKDEPGVIVNHSFAPGIKR